ncbi:uncharacterized protein LOC141854583 isoform X2 [Brevipalpus obovatus]
MAQSICSRVIPNSPMNSLLVDASDGITKRRSAPKVKFSNSTTFLAACACNDYDECRRLLSQNLVNINCSNIDGLTALHQACIDDNVQMVEFLLDHGADVNCCDNEGWTPLHATASCGNKNVARIILDRGADPRIENNDGDFAQDLTDSYAIEEMIKWKLSELGVTNVELLRGQEEICMLEDCKKWASTGLVNDPVHPRTGATILHVAAAKGYHDVLYQLLTKKALRSQFNIDARDCDGWTPLSAACYWQQPRVVKILIFHGADVNVETGSGQRLEDLTDNEEILNMIEEQRAKLVEEKKIQEQQQQLNIANGSQSKVPPSPPSAPTPPTESETQRKAHAKKIRETRRSTTGVSADDVKQAKERLKEATVESLPSVGTSEENIPTDQPPDASKLFGPNLIQRPEGQINCETSSIPYTTTSLATHQTSSNNIPEWKEVNSLPNEKSTLQSQSTVLQAPEPPPPAPIDPSLTDVANILARKRRARKRSSDDEISDVKDNSSLQSKENESVKSTDTVDSITSIDQRDFNSRSLIKDENKYQPSSIASNLTSGSTPTLHVRSRSASRQPYTRDREDAKDYSAPPREPTVQSQQSQQPQSKPLSQIQQQQEQPKDYKKLYEELLVEMENLRKDCSRKEQEWNREKRQLQRKISELEEEVKQLETLKSDNQRLKDENGALIRVISKLSK